MAILREWRVEIRRRYVDWYQRYLEVVVFARYRRLAGNLGVSLAARAIDGQRAEIVVLSWWESWDAIRALPERDPPEAPRGAEDRSFLLREPVGACHYEASIDAPPARGFELG